MVGRVRKGKNRGISIKRMTEARSETRIETRREQKKIISEFILLLKLAEDCPGRKYLSKDVWDIVKNDKISTKLIVENETDRVNWVEYETMTEEEKMLSAYVEKLIDDANDDRGVQNRWKVR